MSLDVYLLCDCCGSELYSANITHNLNTMAEAAGIYKALWRPDELGLNTASQLVDQLRAGLTWLVENRVEAKLHDSPNGWGMYENFVPFVEKYLEACKKWPDARIQVSR